MPQSKAELRKTLRAARREHVAALDPRVKALLFMRPPAQLLNIVPDGAAIGLYAATGDEAPALSYARFFHEAGHRIVLPWFQSRSSAMTFRTWDSPHLDELLATGPFGALQPLEDAEEVLPDLLFVPLVGFTTSGQRLGQGGGHYDRWLEANPDVPAIGLGWDSQRVDSLPEEPHDRPLRAVVTPTRLYGPFDA